MALDASYRPLTYRRAGGDESIIASGGNLIVESGGNITVESGGVVTVAAAGGLKIGADSIAVSTVETVLATNVIAAAESGSTYFLNAAAGFLSTLPAPAAGLRFTFIVQTAPTSNGYTIITNGTTQKVLKGLVITSQDAGGTGDVSAGGTTATFVANQALPGDRIDMICDGTIWYMKGFAQVVAGLTITGE